MSDIEAHLRALVVEVVREELSRAMADRNEGDYLDTDSAAAAARVTPATVRRWIRSGRLARCGAGPRILVRRAELEELLRSGPAAGREQPPEVLARRRFG